MKNAVGCPTNAKGTRRPGPFCAAHTLAVTPLFLETPMNKKPELPNKNGAQRKDHAGEDHAQAGQLSTSQAKAWPFAPGSQLTHQVAKDWTPKRSYRFNQR